jgi:hypothetical protein
VAVPTREHRAAEKQSHTPAAAHSWAQPPQAPSEGAKSTTPTTPCLPSWQADDVVTASTCFMDMSIYLYCLNISA